MHDRFCLVFLYVVTFQQIFTAPPFPPFGKCHFSPPLLLGLAMWPHVECGGSGRVPVRSRALRVHWCGQQPSTLRPAGTRERILLQSGCKVIIGHVTQTCSHRVHSKSWGARNPLRLGGFSTEKKLRETQNQWARIFIHSINVNKFSNYHMPGSVLVRNTNSSLPCYHRLGGGGRKKQVHHIRALWKEVEKGRWL